MNRGCQHPTTVIQRRCPEDGRRWEVQCARCGSSPDFEPCESCDEGSTGRSACIDDLCHGGEVPCMHGDYAEYRCDACRGEGSWPQCCSDYDWCKAHPLPGRENVDPSTPEWFVVEAS